MDHKQWRRSTWDQWKSNTNVMLELIFTQLFQALVVKNSTAKDYVKIARYFASPVRLFRQKPCFVFSRGVPSAIAHMERNKTFFILQNACDEVQLCKKFVYETSICNQVFYCHQRLILKNTSTYCKRIQQYNGTYMDFHGFKQR